jgi:aryl-alcohol dehydrogenase-like predicted oxidoreductase
MTLIRRPLGNTGFKLSIVGLGGIVVMDNPPKKAANIVARAVDAGVNYFDVAPMYGDAEMVLGPALKPYREQSFLACKTFERSASGAAKELNRSLKRLKTDHVDLYQLHALSDVEEDVKTALGSGGAMGAILKARDAGKVRLIGFSAHSVEAALYAMDNFPFDTIMFPVNCVCHYQGGFVEPILKKAKAKNVAVLALKAVAESPWPEDIAKNKRLSKVWYKPLTDQAKLELALRWTLSQKQVVATVATGNEEIYWKVLAAAERFKPLTKSQMQKVKAMTEGVTPLFTLGKK